MVRQSKDLFVLLQERQAQGQRRMNQGRDKPPARGRGVGQWFQDVLQSVRAKKDGGRPAAAPKAGKPKAAASKPAAGRKSAGRAGPEVLRVPRGLFSGGFVIGALLLGLLGGIGIGRLWQSGPSVPQDQNLNAKAGPERPAAFGAGTGVRLDAAAEEELLGPKFYCLAYFSASQRAQAARLAEWCREQGLGSARIHKWQFESQKTKRLEVSWFTVCFPPDPSREAEEKSLLKRLKSLPRPAFIPESQAFPVKEVLIDARR